MPLITLSEVKANMRVDHGDDDVSIQSLIDSAILYAENYTGLTINSTTVAEVYDQFPRIITLEKSPYVSLTNIQYVDPDDVTQTLSSSVYTIDTRKTYARIYEAYGETWPDTKYQPQAVTVNYTAGYTTLPAGLKQGILMVIATMYDQREDHTYTQMGTAAISSDSWLSSYRIYGVNE